LNTMNWANLDKLLTTNGLSGNPGTDPIKTQAPNTPFMNGEGGTNAGDGGCTYADTANPGIYRVWPWTYLMNEASGVSLWSAGTWNSGAGPLCFSIWKGGPTLGFERVVNDFVAANWAPPSTHKTITTPANTAGYAM